MNLDWNISDEVSNSLNDSEQHAVDAVHIPDEDFADTEENTVELQVQRFCTGYSIYQKLLSKSNSITVYKEILKRTPSL